MDQQPVGVDAVGGTCHERAQVPPRFDAQGLHIGRFDGLDAPDSINIRIAQHIEDERVPHLHLVKVGEKQRGRQPSVSRYDRMNALALDRERRTLDMPCPLLQNGFARAVVDREHDVPRRNADIPQDPVPGNIKRTVVLVPEVGGHIHQQVLAFGERLVECLRLFEVGGVVRFRDLLHRGDVVEDRPALPLGVDVTADRRVQQQGQTHDQHQKGKK